MRCPNCGADNTEDAKFCGYCGWRLIQESPPADNTGNPPEKTPAGKRRKMVFFIVAGIILLSAVGVAAVWITKDRQEKEEYGQSLAEADRYLETMDYENAEASYRKAIEIAPREKEPYLGLIQICISQGRFEEAAATAREAQQNLPDEQKEEFQELEETWKDVEDFEWAVEPSVEADDIYYVQEGDFSSSANERKKQFYSEYAVIKRGDTLGLIDMEGNVRTDREYDSITAAAAYFMRREGSGTATYTYDVFYDGQIKYDLRTGFYDELGEYFYWQGRLRNIKEWDIDGYRYREPEGLIPVMNVTGEIEDDNIYRWWDEQEGKYGFYQDGKMLTDFIYDDCGSESDGLIAVKMDGKWGYADETGNLVIPAQYDASWNQYIKGGDVLSSPEEMGEFCYSASDGYVVLVKDEEWEIADTEGNTVIPAGVFEKICPVYEGRCWVKQNGKWGVIRLGQSSRDTLDTKEPDAGEQDEPDYREAYEDLVDQAYAQYGEYILYGLYDIDKDGVKELLLQNGTCEADYTYQIYTVQDGEPLRLGEVNGGHSAFYADEAGGTEHYIIRVQAHMGNQSVYRISIENGAPSEELIMEGELEGTEEYYSTPYPIDLVYVTDKSLIE